MSYQFEMFRVTAQTVITEMVYLHFARDVSVIMGIGHNVCSRGNSIHGNPTILTTSTIPRVGTSPDVA
jgi:hypothetical protein